MSNGRLGRWKKMCACIVNGVVLALMGIQRPFGRLTRGAEARRRGGGRQWGGFRICGGIMPVPPSGILPESGAAGADALHKLCILHKLAFIALPPSCLCLSSEPLRLEVYGHIPGVEKTSVRPLTGPALPPHPFRFIPPKPYLFSRILPVSPSTSPRVFPLHRPSLFLFQYLQDLCCFFLHEGGVGPAFHVQADDGFGI